MNVQGTLMRKLMFDEFKLSHKAMEVTKNISCVKDEGIVEPDGSRNFAGIATKSMIRQGQVNLKPWILRLCS